MSTLGVWMNGRYVGAWQQVRGGRDRFSYNRDWISDPQSRALSLSLPMTSDAAITSAAVGFYFDNLLPDSQGIRDRIQARFATRSASTFDLLEAIGRDCAGAVQLLPEGEEPKGWDRLDVRRLRPKEIEAILRAVPTISAPLLNGIQRHDDFRISLAGAQEKTALTKIGRHWYKPVGSTPTTHILKLPLGLVGNRRLDLSHSVDNEWLCVKLLRELGIPVANTEIGQFGAQRALIVERFDRRWQNVGDGDPRAAGFEPLRDTWIARLPQEDFCQVTGRPHTAKYENEGGPSMHDILNELARAEHSASDQRLFMLSQLVFWMLAATDGHAKNFSIYHHRGGGFGLTPLYDVLSTWPVVGKRADQLDIHELKLAMALRGKSAHYKVVEIQPRHFRELADRYPDAEAWPAMIELAGRVEGAIEAVEGRLPKGFAESVWGSTSKGMLAQAKLFLSQAKA
ncbi:MAG TPA: type II toxin-antitoxin system HipA family toxin [Steroidobacteraceae bacterium]|nr:type II toxin-antitoxin system HipA family toxin [Steroidobacteraceae bacterium]